MDFETERAESAPLRILVVEDNGLDATLLRVRLAELPAARFELVLCRTLVEGLMRLGRERFDVAVLDLMLPDSMGTQTVRWVRAQDEEIPIVVLTSADDPDLVAEAIDAGAQDYLVKGRVASQLLWRTLRGVARAPSEFVSEDTAPDIAALVRDRTDVLERSREGLERVVRGAATQLGGELMALAQAVHGLERGLDDLPEHLAAHVESAAAALQRTAALHHDLDRFARVADGPFRRVSHDLVPVAREIAAGLRAEHPRRAVRLTVDHQLPVEADPDLLRTTLQLLLERAWTSGAQRVHLGASTNCTPAVYFVRDDGPGAEPTVAGALFEPSAGDLPLSTVRRAVRRHRGLVWAEAEPDAGTTIYFTLSPGAPEAWRLTDAV